MKYLHVAPGLDLPLELAARTQAILAMKGSGKTYTALRETEEMLSAGVQVVALDPTGVWWGLRSPSTPSNGKAFDVVILGGEHGDAPLETTAGAVVAEFAVKSGRSVVLDLSAFESNAAQDRFAADFAEKLYRLKAAERATLHLMVDEADSFAPQRPMPGQQRMLGAFEAIARRGRSRGLGLTLISQRPAVLNKNVLSQADLLVCGRIVGPHDHKAVSDWASLYGTREQIEQFTLTLPQLATGEVWCWSPEWLRVFQRVKVSRRLSFDSSSTPATGTVRTAAKMMEVDLEGLTREIQATIETAKANDPRELKTRIAALERELAEARKVKPIEKLVDVPALSAKHASLIERAIKVCEELTPSLKETLLSFRKADASKPSGDPYCAHCRSYHPKPRDKAHHTALQCFGPAPRETAPVQILPRPANMTSVSAPVSLGKAERKILTVLKQYAPASVGKSRVALIAGYSVNGGGFNNPLSKLRTLGFITGSDPLWITAAGSVAIGDVPPLPTGPDLLEYWTRELGKAEGLILRALANAPDGRLRKHELADATGYAVDGGGFNNPLSKLRTLQLISGSQELQLAEELR